MGNRNHLRQKRHKEDGKATDAFSERQSFRNLTNDRFLTRMLQLFSFHEMSGACGEQKPLSCLKKRAKIIVSHFSPGDEEVTQTVEFRITGSNTALGRSSSIDRLKVETTPMRVLTPPSSPAHAGTLFLPLRISIVVEVIVQKLLMRGKKTKKRREFRVGRNAYFSVCHKMRSRGPSWDFDLMYS